MKKIYSSPVSSLTIASIIMAIVLLIFIKTPLVFAMVSISMALLSMLLIFKGTVNKSEVVLRRYSCLTFLTCATSIASTLIFLMSLPIREILIFIYLIVSAIAFIMSVTIFNLNKIEYGIRIAFVIFFIVTTIVNIWALI